MNITEVKIFKLDDSGATKALASITINNEFVVGGMKVLDGKNGLWVAMPNRKNKQDEYKDICFPITREAREQIIKAVLDKFGVQDSVQDTSRNIIKPPSREIHDNKEVKYDIDESSDLPF
jgi:stage V sporulation protein G